MKRCTSYTSGTDFPLGLVLQYSGTGLWGRDYSLRGPTVVHYALLPHACDWQEADLWIAGNAWHEPFVAAWVQAETMAAGEMEKSLLTVDGGGWEVPTMRMDDGVILVRLFNASASSEARTIRFGAPATKVELVQLNGQRIQQLRTRKDRRGRTVFELAIPQLGIGTLSITP